MMGKFYLLFVIIFVLDSSLALAAKGQKTGHRRFRFSAMAGQNKYTSTSWATNAKTEYENLEPAARLELDFWYGRKIGMFFEGEGILARVNLNPQIYYAHYGASLAFRVLGNGTFDSSEFVIAAGPQIQYFPEVRGYVGRNPYDLLRQQLLGFKGETQIRIKLSKSVMLHLEGYWVRPYKIRVITTSLSKLETRSTGGFLLLEHSISKKSSVGLGGAIDYKRLSHRPSTNEIGRQQTVDMQFTSLIFSVLFSF